ncbi:MAG: flagellar protein FlaG [Pseudomonadota bacterium]|jgi:flagellar protein FlaG|uniref:flagellar protein FlaG n=1 Tax=Thalassolituus sp. UBA3500 TaxID=1947664 RepID=UPI00263BC4C5|nr:flagellar protein FlaG [Thalassolituus sp. UBA3500]MEC8907651.1 flagellar protein FlaG [Pseudomonadota bacterium]MED5440226.1 flagellar protein FlaG [Pseudomonadota bacterium]|tara:strand:+ start:399 stop:782 length:384 start_codon:yes stop_codon:yes gene_type:complete
MNELRNNMMDKSAAASTVSVTQGQSAKVNVSADISATSGKELPQGTEARAEVSSDKVRDAVSRINEYVQQTERTLDFKLDENSGKTVISVYDKASAELIRQIPSELALELAQKLNDEEPSLLFSAQV